ncbi:MAG TPA: hypothetical protein VES02_11975 [Dermatophilaceae bacterium]|nr:hypothetical protein [Dermatophilaceae bacterium]
MTGTAARGFDVAADVDVAGAVVEAGDGEVDVDGVASAVLVAVDEAPEEGATDFAASSGDELHAAITTTDDTRAVVRQNPLLAGFVMVTPHCAFLL